MFDSTPSTAAEAQQMPLQQRVALNNGLSDEPSVQFNEKLNEQCDLLACDVLIIGGGPAGSTVATLLAQKGYHTVMMEKAHHPRFHIGESLLPLNLPLLEKLGVRGAVEAKSMVKHGVEFHSHVHQKSVMLEFKDAWDKDHPYAYQVRRSEFDHILIKNAAARGAQVIEGCRVRRVDFDDGDNGSATVHATLDDGAMVRYSAKFVVDASGRDTVLANQFEIKKKNQKHNSAAVYGHFRNAQRLPGKLEGNITVFWFEHGWFWFIPLADGTTSVGAVCWPYYMKSRKKSPTEFFMDTIAMCPALAERLKDATLEGEATATGNYSYAATRSSGKNYLMLGDAFAFIDPVFSSGVFLAMNSGFKGAETIDQCLREPAKAASALKAFDRVMQKGPRDFSWFIYRITSPAMRDLLMAPRNDWRVLEAILSVLAGDIFRGTPITGRLMVFRCIYYITSLFQVKKSWMAWRKRKHNVTESVPQHLVTNR